MVDSNTSGLLRDEGARVACGADPLLAHVVDSYNGPAVVVDGEEEIVLINSTARDLMGADEVWWPLILEWIALGAYATRPVCGVVVQTPDGVRHVEWSAVPLPDGACLLLGRDLTFEQQLRQTLTESRQRYKDIVEISSEFAWETGANGRFVFVSPRGALGHAAEALIDRDPVALFIDRTMDVPSPFVARRVMEDVETWLIAADGQPMCLAISAMPIHDARGRWQGARGVCRDVTQQVNRSYELAQMRMGEQLLAHIAQTLRDRVDSAEGIDEAAEEATRVLGAEGCRIYRCDAAARVDATVAFGEVPPGLGRLLPTVLETEGPTTLLHPSLRLIGCRSRYRGTVNGVLFVWRRADGPVWTAEERSLVAGVCDRLGVAHAKIAYHQRLKRLSERDSLTGLLNKHGFDDRLREQLSRADTGPSSLFYVDLDNFKPVNDTFGHEQGDAVLKALAALLTERVRPGDLPGRIGGDEFLLWLARTEESQAVLVAQRLLQGIAGLGHLSASPDKPLGLSIGIAVYRPHSGEDCIGLIDRADQAMYAAKRGGKNAYAIAPPTLLT